MTQQPPLVPYLGVFLRDLTFIEIGNETYLDEEQRMINFDKFRMLASVVETFQGYQVVPYDFDTVPTVQIAFRHSVLTLDPDELYNVSLIVEPSSLKRKGSTVIVSRSSSLFKSLKRSIT